MANGARTARRGGTGAALVAALAVLLAGGCGGGDDADDPRERVNAYVRTANAVQARFAGDFTRANEAYEAYARGELAPASAEADLGRAEASIAAARDQLAELRPPRDARELHERMLRYVDMSLGFAGETATLAVYTPAAEAALAPLAGANKRLNRRLSGATEPADQAGALRRFTSDLGAIVAALRALDVPAVLRPTHATQVRRLARTEALARQLRDALLDQDAERVAQLLERFRSNRAGGGERRRLANRAIRRYERRYRALIEANAEVRREQARLDAELRE